MAKLTDGTKHLITELTITTELSTEEELLELSTWLTEYVL
jgi:hypothetical protein